MKLTQNYNECPEAFIQETMTKLPASLQGRARAALKTVLAGPSGHAIVADMYCRVSGGDQVEIAHQPRSSTACLINGQYCQIDDAGRVSPATMILN